MSDIPRCGDHVLHRATGETWVVAYADPETGYLAWVGWPHGRAFISECDIVRRCSDEEHQNMVAGLLDNPHPHDSRPAVIRRLYRTDPPPPIEPMNDHELAAMLAVAENTIAKNPTAVVMVSAGDVLRLVARMRADIATARHQATESAHIACAYAVADAPKGQEAVWAAAAKHCQKHITERARDEQAEREAKGNG